MFEERIIALETKLREIEAKLLRPQPEPAPQPEPKAESKWPTK